jgi:hypothetical protein
MYPISSTSATMFKGFKKYTFIYIEYEIMPANDVGPGRFSKIAGREAYNYRVGFDRCTGPCGER